MELRNGRMEDRRRIREISEQSFEASYSLSPDQITTIVESVLSEEALADRIEDSGVLLVVSEDEVDEETRIVGFADVDLAVKGCCAGSTSTRTPGDEGSVPN